MHLLPLGCVFLTLAFLANAHTGPYWSAKCERKCGPPPQCYPSRKCAINKLIHGRCMKKCEEGRKPDGPCGTCVNNDRTRDSHGDTCSDHYDDFPQDCGHFPTPWFNSYRQCCACGGGKRTPPCPKTTPRPKTTTSKKPPTPITNIPRRYPTGHGKKIAWLWVADNVLRVRFVTATKYDNNKK